MKLKELLNILNEEGLINDHGKDVEVLFYNDTEDTYMKLSEVSFDRYGGCGCFDGFTIKLENKE